MMRHFAKIVGSLALVVGVGLPTLLQATNGLWQIGYGVKSKGMGGIGIAYAQDSFAGAMNPAGLVHVGCRADVGVHWVKQKATRTFIEERDSCLRKESKTDEDLVWPEIGVNWMVCPDQSIGLAIYYAGQSRVRYDKVFGEIHGGDPARLDFAHVFLTPTWSWQFDDCNSFGLAVNIAFSRLQLKGAQFLREESIDPDRVTNKGEDWELGLGARLGWTHQLFDCFRLGVVYQTKTWLGHFHKYRGLLPNRGQAYLPSQVGLGFAWWPRCNLLLAFDLVKIFWRDGKWFENVGIDPKDYSNRRDLGANEGAGLGWNEQMVYKVGIAWDFLECLTLRGGFNYGNSVVPPGNFLSFLVPITVTQHITFGASYRWCSSELSIDYIHARAHDVHGLLDNRLLGGHHGNMNQSLRSWQRSVGLSYGRCF